MINEMVENLRIDWAKSDMKRDEEFSTPEGIKKINDVSYGPYGKWNLLDIYYPENLPKLNPVIVSIHGGAWVYGTKETYQCYCMNLAGRGFTVVNFSYRLAPEHHYPDALEDINNVFRFLSEQASKYPLDLKNVFVVGDSAGAQLASQYLIMLTNPVYAKQFDFDISDIKPRAAALNCGIYDVARCAEFGLNDYFKEYVGVSEASMIENLSALKYLTADFPPTYLASACHDYLLENTAPMHEMLANLNIDCRMKIYGSREQEEMSHVFHLNLKLPGATQCNDDECDFFKAHCEF